MELAPKKIVSIQYLRALAALAVVYHHAFENRLGASLKGDAFGIWGVDVFFIISGFIMWTTTSVASPSSPSFWEKRIVRIYPIYWIALTVWILSRFLIPDKLDNADVTSQTIVFSFFLIPHYHLVFPTRIWPILIPGWTLQYEVFFYFLFGLFLMVRSASTRAITMLSTLAGLVLTGIVFSFKNPALVTYTSPLLLEFAAGVLVGLAFEADLMLPFWAAVCAMMTAIPLLLIAEYTMADYGRWLYLGLPSLLLSFGAISIERRLAQRPIVPIVALGDASYSLYLFHPIIIAAVAVALSLAVKNIHPAIFVSLSLIAATFLSLFIHHYLERPIIRLTNAALQKAATFLRVSGPQAQIDNDSV